MEEINQNPTKKLFLILAGVLVFGAFVFGSYWLGRLQQPPPTQIVEEIPVCQVDADCILAIEVGSACFCPKVASKDQLQRNKNLVPYEEGKDYSRPNSRVVCALCPAPPETVICDIGLSDNSCRAATKIEAELSYEARKAVNLVKEDLVRKLNIEIQKIGFLKAQKEKWGNTSLGCPQPGVMYSEVITEGWQIFLQVYGVVYDYRVGRPSSVYEYYVTPCQSGNQLYNGCTKDSDCPSGLVCVGRGPTQPSPEIPGVCLSQKQSQGMQ